MQISSLRRFGVFSFFFKIMNIKINSRNSCFRLGRRFKKRKVKKDKTKKIFWVQILLKAVCIPSAPWKKYISVSSFPTTKAMGKIVKQSVIKLKPIQVQLWIEIPCQYTMEKHGRVRPITPHVFQTLGKA